MPSSRRSVQATSLLFVAALALLLVHDVTANTNEDAEKVKLCKPLWLGTRTLDTAPEFQVVKVPAMWAVGKLVAGYIAPGSLYGCWYVNCHCEVFDATGEKCTTDLPGICSKGVTECTDEGELVCRQRFWPVTEICGNNKDDDCDGTVDENCNGSQETCTPGQPCSTGMMGVCASGTTVCNGTMQSCEPTTPASPETCNLLDDDCDGQTDEGLDCSSMTCTPGAACSTGELGVCSAGTVTCNDSMPTCVRNTDPSDEACNLMDDDCDGQVDEGQIFPFPTAPPCDTPCSGAPCQNGSYRCVNGDMVCAPLNPQCGPSGSGQFQCSVQGMAGMSP